MRPVSLDGISDEFLHCFLHYHRLNWVDLSIIQKGKRNFIGNEALINNIKFHFAKFQSLGVDLGTYFNRQIVSVTRQGQTNRCLIKDTEFTNIPLFIIKAKNNGERSVYGEPQVYSKVPIKMPLDKLCQFLQISFTNLSFEVCPRDVDMFKVENNVCFSDFESPGSSKNHKLIGYDGTNAYWIPTRDIIKKRFFCTRNPGRCSMYFDKRFNLDAHEAICTVETKITSKQVNFIQIRYIL